MIITSCVNKYRVNRYPKSTIALLNDLSSIIKNTPFNEHIKFKANVIRISRSIFGFLTVMIHNYLSFDRARLRGDHNVRSKSAMYGFYQSRKAEVFSHLIKSIIA